MAAPAFRLDRDLSVSNEDLTHPESVVSMVFYLPERICLLIRHGRPPLSIRAVREIAVVLVRAVITVHFNLARATVRCTL